MPKNPSLPSLINLHAADQLLEDEFNPYNATKVYGKNEMREAWLFLERLGIKSNKEIPDYLLSSNKIIHKAKKKKSKDN